MNRRGFLAALAGLPFVGRLVGCEQCVVSDDVIDRMIRDVEMAGCRTCNGEGWIITGSVVVPALPCWECNDTRSVLKDVTFKESPQRSRKFTVKTPLPPVTWRKL